MAESKQPRECGMCAMEFNDDSSLSAHTARHSNRPHFNCTECEYVVVTRSALQAHMLNHRVSDKYKLHSHIGRFN